MEKVVFGVVYIFISFVHLLVCWKCGIPLFNECASDTDRASERVGLMILFTAYAAVVAAIVVVVTTAATAIAAIAVQWWWWRRRRRWWWLCVWVVWECVCSLLSVQAQNQNRMGFKHIVWFLVKTLNNCYNSLLWSLLQSGCWNFTERRFSKRAVRFEQLNNNITAAPKHTLNSIFVFYIACIYNC